MTTRSTDSVAAAWAAAEDAARQAKAAEKAWIEADKAAEKARARALAMKRVRAGKK